MRAGSALERTARCKATSIRHSCSDRWTACCARRIRCWRAQPDVPAISSTWGTASCPPHRWNTCRCWRSMSTAPPAGDSSGGPARLRQGYGEGRQSAEGATAAGPAAGVRDVVVIGAGISGLAAAYELQRRGATVRIVESSDRAGGVIDTERRDGWVIDGGPDSILVQKPAAVALCRELGIADRLIHTLPPRTAYVVRDGRLHPIAEGSFLGFPISLKALATTSLFTIGGRLRMAGEMLIPRRSGDEDESVASFVRRRFGDEAVDYIADPLLAGIHAGDADRLSMRALFPRLVDAERQHGSVIRAFRALHVKPSAQGAFVSFPGGVRE